MESVDVGDAVLLHRQIPLIHQTIQHSSGAAVRHLQNASGFFYCDFRVVARMVHPFQQLLLSLCESIGSQRCINQAVLKGIHHIRHKGRNIQPFVLSTTQDCLRIRQAAVIAAELVVDGAGQRQAFHLPIPGMVQLGGIQDSGGSAVSVTERMQIHKVETVSVKTNVDLQ